MTVSGLHLLLTYRCTSQCHHCFVWGSPWSRGVMTTADVTGLLEEGERLGSVRSIYFEGGEPFLHYATLLKGVAEATRRGFSSGIVSNGYWAISREDAHEALRPLVGAGLGALSISSDLFHNEVAPSPEARHALQAARELGLAADLIAVEMPPHLAASTAVPGEPIRGGAVMFRGRAAIRLSPGAPLRPWEGFAECPHETLDRPSRLHLDPLGFVHLCQGLTLGNWREVSLSALLSQYRAREHPIVAPLLAGGPTALAKEFDLSHQEGYVDACHLCYEARRALRPRFPQYLAPGQMYGEADVEAVVPTAGG